MNSDGYKHKWAESGEAWCLLRDLRRRGSSARQKDLGLLGVGMYGRERLEHSSHREDSPASPEITEANVLCKAGELAKPGLRHDL